MSIHNRTLSYSGIFRFWVPLAATWLMMAVEGPFIAAIIARLVEPKFNLAAYGIAFAFALIIEAPIIMMMSATVALVHDHQSYIKMLRYTVFLNTMITLIMIALIIPSVFNWIATGLIDLPENVARLSYWGTALLLPWPAAIGFRRFYQGVMIRVGRTRRVAYGTIIRLITMASTGALLAVYTDIPGVCVGATALSAGVISESISTRWMAGGIIRQLKTDTDSNPPVPEAMRSAENPALDTPLTYRHITRFYIPLALSSIMGLGIYPVVNFFVGHARMPIESLAVLPVINSLNFIFGSIGLSYQEVGIALLTDRPETYRKIRNFSLILIAVVESAICAIAFTPLASIWFHTISGLSETLTAFSITPFRIGIVIPGLMIAMSFLRSVLVKAKSTTPISIATAVEVAGIAGAMFVFTRIMDVNGAISAVSAMFLGRFAATVYLVPPSVKARNRYLS